MLTASLSGIAGDLVETMEVADPSRLAPDSRAKSQFRVAVSDTAGNAITSAAVDETFLVNVYAADLRDGGQGVFAAYLDLLFDPTRVRRAGDVVFGEKYPNGASRGGSAPGILDEVGAFGSGRPIGSGEYLVVSVPFRAASTGLVSFVTDPPDHTPWSDILMYGGVEPVDASHIAFGSRSLEIVRPRTADSLLSPAQIAFMARDLFVRTDTSRSGVLSAGQSTAFLPLALSSASLTQRPPIAPHTVSSAILAPEAVTTKSAAQHWDCAETPFWRTRSWTQLTTLGEGRDMTAQTGGVLPDFALAPMDSSQIRFRSLALRQSANFGMRERGTAPQFSVATTSSAYHLDVHIDRHWLRHGFLRWRSEPVSHTGIARNVGPADDAMLDLGAIAYLAIGERAANHGAGRPVPTEDDAERLMAIEEVLAQGIEVTGAHGAAVEVDKLDGKGAGDGHDGSPPVVHRKRFESLSRETPPANRGAAQPDATPAT